MALKYLESCGDSPGFNAGRGLKLFYHRRRRGQLGDSPGFNAGRGLKQIRSQNIRHQHADSPGFNAGRGLKPIQRAGRNTVVLIRPALMPGVD